MSKLHSRREILTITGAATVGAMLPTTTIAQPPNRTRSLRIAHVADIHVQPERGAAEGMARCLRHAQDRFKPDLFINGGDAVMDACQCDLARAHLQGKLFQSVIKSESSVPFLHCIGNHDVWGIDKQASASTGGEPLYGKKFAMDLLNLSERYYSTNRGGWHIVVLDSTFIDGETYRGELDQPQFDWLKNDLAKVDPATPVLVVSHIPILSVCSFFDGPRIDAETNIWNVPGSYMHADARRLKQLFYKHRNVKLCLSGHIHLVDRCDYLGVTYLCSGAVSASWWKGPSQEFENGCMIVDLLSDGTFEHQYVTYGWQARQG